MSHHGFELADLSNGPLFLERGTAETYGLAHGALGKKALEQSHFLTLKLFNAYKRAFKKGEHLRRTSAEFGYPEEALRYGIAQVFALTTGSPGGALDKLEQAIRSNN